MTMIAIGVTVTAVGAGISAYGQYQSGKAQQDMANYNAKLAENEAIATQQLAHAETERMNRDKLRLMSAQRAGYAKSGAVMTEGTPLLLMAEQAAEMELDMITNQRNRALQARALRSQATLDRYSGKVANYAGKVGAGTTVLGAVGGVASAAGMAYSPKPTQASSGG